MKNQRSFSLHFKLRMEDIKGVEQHTQLNVLIIEIIIALLLTFLFKFKASFSLIVTMCLYICM